MPTTLLHGGVDGPGGLPSSDRLCSSWQRLVRLVADDQFLAREDIITVEDPQLGPMRMPGIVPKTPGFEHQVPSTGPALGQHNAEIYRERLGLSDDDLAALRRDGVLTATAAGWRSGNAWSAAHSRPSGSTSSGGGS